MGQGVEKARTELDRLINENPEAAPLAKMIADNLTSAGNIEGAREVLSNAVKATQGNSGKRSGYSGKLILQAYYQQWISYCVTSMKRVPNGTVKSG